MNSRYFIHLSYDGTYYHGWQIQPNAPTIQETLNKALSVILNSEINLVGAGRTDTGVHARNFYAHFDIKEEIKPTTLDKIVYQLNGYLPKDIVIYSLFKVKEDDHCRFSATLRTYHYYIHQHKNPFLEQYSTFLPFQLDVDKMNKACQCLYQYTDFTSFAKLHAQTKTNDCKISEAKWTKDKDQLVFIISADRFLRNMVRAIVGTMIEIGKGKLAPEDLNEIIESKDRSNAKASAPAKGLFLTNIEYPKGILPVE